MRDGDDLHASLRAKASDLLDRLGAPARQALLVKGWMSHDARWFMAVAREHGMEAANRLNRIAARQIGAVEARRIVRAVPLPPARTVDDVLLTQEVFIGLLGPDLLDYRVAKVGEDAFRVDVRRCFAHDNAARAGVAERYECGIFERMLGWLDGLGLAYETSPPLGRCLQAQGYQCSRTVTLARPAS